MVKKIVQLVSLNCKLLERHGISLFTLMLMMQYDENPWVQWCNVQRLHILVTLSLGSDVTNCQCLFNWLIYASLRFQIPCLLSFKLAWLSFFSNSLYCTIQHDFFFKLINLQPFVRGKIKGNVFCNFARQRILMGLLQVLIYKLHTFKSCI